MTTKRSPDDPMRGTFANVTEGEADALREAGFLPVLRWTLVSKTGAMGERVYKTREARAMLARKDRAHAKKPAKKTTRKK